MEKYGYQILQSLVTDLEPDGRVRQAMNEINASKRLKEAAWEKAEADKILVVKSAVRFFFLFFLCLGATSYFFYPPFAMYIHTTGLIIN